MILATVPSPNFTTPTFHIAVDYTASVPISEAVIHLDNNLITACRMTTCCNDCSYYKSCYEQNNEFNHLFGHLNLRLQYPEYFI